MYPCGMAAVLPQVSDSDLENLHGQKVMGICPGQINSLLNLKYFDFSCSKHSNKKLKLFNKPETTHFCTTGVKVPGHR